MSGSALEFHFQIIYRCSAVLFKYLPPSMHKGMHSKAGLKNSLTSHIDRKALRYSCHTVWLSNVSCTGTLEGE